LETLELCGQGLLRGGCQPAIRNTQKPGHGGPPTLSLLNKVFDRTRRGPAALKVNLSLTASFTFLAASLMDSLGRRSVTGSCGEVNNVFLMSVLHAYDCRPALGVSHVPHSGGA
jgi:hypothetical protein